MGVLCLDVVRGMWSGAYAARMCMYPRYPAHGVGGTRTYVWVCAYRICAISRHSSAIHAVYGTAFLTFVNIKALLYGFIFLRATPWVLGVSVWDTNS